MKQRVIIKNTPGYYDGERNFIVIPVSDDTRKELSQFCELPDTDELLFCVSKYAAVSAIDGLDVDELSARVGSATISVKLEAVEYDWSYKGKKGHTKKWQACGVVFKSELVNSKLEGLEDD